MHSKWMRTKRRYCGTGQRHVRIMCFLLEQLKKLPGWDKHPAKNRSIVLLHGGKRRKMWKDIANWQTKKGRAIVQSFKSLLRWPSHQEDELESAGELSQVCAQIVFKCLYLARTGRPDILWSVNKLSRSVNKSTQARDRRLARFISYIHHTRNYRQRCHVGNAAQHCRSSLCQDSDFVGVLEDSKSTS